MGYSRDLQGRLCCDNCGQPGGVRKRTCPYKVVGDTLRSVVRYSLPYCPAPALCSRCYVELGGLRGVHGDSCRDGAAAAQAEHDATEALLDEGEHLVIAAYGSWHDEVPEGWTGLRFRNRTSEVARLVPAQDYDNRGPLPTLSDFKTAKEWNL